MNSFPPCRNGAQPSSPHAASSAASAANGDQSVRALTTDTPEGDSFSSICSDGSYGTTAGLITSLPCRGQMEHSKLCKTSKSMHSAEAKLTPRSRSWKTNEAVKELL